MVHIDLESGDVDILIAALDAAPVRGEQAMRKLIALIERLRSSLESKDVPHDRDPDSG